MKLKWIKRKVHRIKGAFIYLSDKGPYMWQSLGDIIEVPDDIAYEILKKHAGLVEKHEEKEESKPKPIKKKKVKVPQTKVMKKYEDK
jgi:hypothetical protein